MWNHWHGEYWRDANWGCWFFIVNIPWTWRTVINGEPTSIEGASTSAIDKLVKNNSLVATIKNSMNFDVGFTLSICLEEPEAWKKLIHMNCSYICHQHFFLSAYMSPYSYEVWTALIGMNLLWIFVWSGALKLNCMTLSF